MGRPHPALVEVAADRPLPAVDDFDALVASAVEHRMAGLLFSRALASELVLAQPHLAALARHDLRVRAHQRRLWAALATVTARIEQAGFEVAAVKGVVAEARWYQRAGERPCVDVDLLVAPRDLPRVAEVVRLLRADHRLLPAMPSLIAGGHLQWVDVEVDDGLWVDLHLDLFKLGIPVRRPEEVWARTLPFPLPAGGNVRALDAEMSLVHFLLHLNHDRFSYLLGFADVARILDKEELDWGFIRRFVLTEGLETPVSLALETVLTVLGLADATHLRPRGWRSPAWKLLWPVGSVLQADAGARRERRRHFCLPFLARGRTVDALAWLARRAFPPRALVDYWLGTDPSPYVWRLTFGRLGRVLRRRRMATERKGGERFRARSPDALNQWRKGRMSLLPTSRCADRFAPPKN